MPVNISLLPDEVIARGVTPPDYSKGFDSFFAGQAQAQKQAEQNLFSGGLPKTPAGDIDWAEVGQRLARLQGAGAIPSIIGLRKTDIQQQAVGDRGDLTSPSQVQPYRPPLPPSPQRGGTLQTAPAAEDSAAGSGGVPAPPGQNLVQPNEVPGSFKVTTDEPGQTLTARSLAKRSGQDPDLVASKLGVGLDQPLTPAEVRGRLQDIRPDAASFDERFPGGAAPETAGITPTRVATTRIQAPTEGATPAQVTIPAQQQAQAPSAPTQASNLAPIPEGQPGYWSEDNALRYENRERALSEKARKYGAAGAELAPAAKAIEEQAQREGDRAKQIREHIGKSLELTPDMKEAARLGIPLDQYLRTKSDIPEDVKAFRKDFTAIQESGRNALVNITKAEAAKNLTLDPNYTSGPWSDQAKAYQQFRSLFGNRVGDIKAASPIEASEKLANDLVGEGIRSMGQAGVRVLRSEIPIIQRATANQGVTANTNRMLWEFATRTYQKQAEIAKITQGLPPNSAILNKTVDQYLEAHPFLSEQERQNPNLLGSPNAPPGSTNWAPQQWRNWAAGAGLRSGDTIKVGPDTYGHIP